MHIKNTQLGTLANLIKGKIFNIGTKASQGLFILALKLNIYNPYPFKRYKAVDNIMFKVLIFL
ncbi:hypothetical protein BN174_3780007 [Clostridioides difficile E15]|nr:hypothetical protein BN174_3780007 [Clostridioides difficile E15]